VTLGTLVSKMTVLSTLEARDLVQSLKSMRSPVSHGVHSVVILCVGHEGLPWLGPLLVLQLLGHLGAVADLVTHLPTVVASDDHFLAHLWIHVRGSWQFKSRMCIWTRGSSRTEASQVVNAEDSSYVAVATIGTMAAEPSVVPRTVTNLGLWVYVEERALFVMTGIKPGVEVALRHLAHVVLVQELALVPLLAEPPQPVLAYNRFISPHMSEGTGSSPLARRPDIEVTHSSPTLVHAREGKGLGSQLLGQGNLNVKCDVFYGGYQELHGECYDLKLL